MEKSVLTYGPCRPSLHTRSTVHNPSPLRETWLRKQTARREVMIDYCLYRHRSPAAECSLSQEHTPVSRLSCAWQGSMHGGCRALSQRQRPRLVSSRLDCLHTPLQKRSQPPDICAANNGLPRSPFDSTRHGLSSRSPADKSCEPRPSPNGKDWVFPGFSKAPFFSLRTEPHLPRSRDHVSIT